jgi:hypothetical protein
MDRMTAWLAASNATVMAVMLLVIGVSSIRKRDRRSNLKASVGSTDVRGGGRRCYEVC